MNSILGNGQIDEIEVHTLTDWIQNLYFIHEKSLKKPKGNQHSYIEEEPTRQWPKEKVQKDKQ